MKSAPDCCKVDTYNPSPCTKLRCRVTLLLSKGHVSVEGTARIRTPVWVPLTAVFSTTGQTEVMQTSCSSEQTCVRTIDNNIPYIFIDSKI